MVFEEDEPFDSLGGNGPPPAASSQLRKSSPSFPPAAAFGKSANSSVPPPNAPPAAAFGNSPSQPLSSVPTPLATQTPSQPTDAAVVTPQDDVELPGSWKQYENQMDAHRSESALGVDRSVVSASEREATRRFLNDEEDKVTSLPSEKRALSESDNQSAYSNYKLSSQVTGGSNDASGLAPRQPYSFKKSSSYDTNELIRKYGVVAGIPQSVSSSGSFGGGRSVSTEPPKPTAPSPRQRETSHDVRQEALEVLALVDDHLSSPLNVTRTRSGGFRATPFNNSSSDHGAPFDIRRTQSGGVRATPHVGDPGQLQARPQFTRSASSGGAYDSNGKRLPSALTGLQLSSPSNNRSSWKAGRYSFKDPSFREDDDNSVEDDIIKNGNSFQDETSPIIDVISLENRAMASRATSLNNTGIPENGSFDGDFPRQTPSSWSSRYSDTFSNQKRILDQWDRDYDNERRTTSAKNMIMSTAHSMKSAAGNVWTGAHTQSEKVFGPGFSFRKNFVFGKQSGSDRSDMNLRTAWKDMGEDEIAGSSVHKSWQEVMLSKKKRRRVLMIFGVILLAIFVIIGVSVKSSKPNGGESKVKAADSKFGSSVTFYVTSDVPYDNDERLKLSKDLYNVPVDGDFLVHLGNIQKASETLCPWTRYANVASLLKEAQIPVFMLPGAEDWTLCPNPTASLTDWKDSFEDFQRNFVHGLDVYHDEINPEAFAIVHDGVLFLGMHLVNGPVHNTTDWASREVQMLTFYFGMTNVHKDKFRAIVIMANARPSPQQDEFFRNVYLSLNEIKKPLLYIHANSGGGSVREYYPVDNDNSIVAVEVEDGGKNPPLKITVGYGQRPFLIG